MNKYTILQNRIVQDLTRIGIPVSFELLVKDYSKSFYGCFRPNTNRVYIYYYEDEDCTSPYSYEHLFSIAVHESVHTIQWSDPSFVRVKGVMHNEEFRSMYEHYISLAREIVFSEETESHLEKDDASTVIGFQKRVVCNNTGSASRSSNRVLRVACRRGV